MLVDGAPEQKALSHRDAETPASFRQQRQTRGDPGRERRPEDLSGRLITAAHASLASLGETETRLDWRVGTHARSRIRERSDGKTEMTILRIRLETAGEAKILFKLALGEVNTNIPEIGTPCALMTVQDDMTLKRCKATDGEGCDCERG